MPCLLVVMERVGSLPRTFVGSLSARDAQDRAQMTNLEIKQRSPKSAKRGITAGVTLLAFGLGLAIPGFIFQEACINAEASLEKQRPGWFDFSEAVGIGFAKIIAEFGFYIGVAIVLCGGICLLIGACRKAPLRMVSAAALVLAIGLQIFMYWRLASSSG
jgi:hypothetical protein